MNKTIYIPDSEAELYSNAHKILGEPSLSVAITNLLKAAVEQKKREKEIKEYTFTEIAGYVLENPIRIIGKKVAYCQLKEEKGIACHRGFYAFQTKSKKLAIVIRSDKNDRQIYSVFNSGRDLYQNPTYEWEGEMLQFPENFVKEIKEVLGSEGLIETID